MTSTGGGGGVATSLGSHWFPEASDSPNPATWPWRQAGLSAGFFRRFQVARMLGRAVGPVHDGYRSPGPTVHEWWRHSEFGGSLARGRLESGPELNSYTATRMRAHIRMRDA